MAPNNISNSAYSPIVTGVPERKVTPNQQLGKDQFLEILMVQLKNQDPLSPLQDKDFIAQMAQFTSLEQLTNMNTNLKSSLDEMRLMRESLGMTSALIDKTITWTIPGIGGLPSASSSGKVESITIRDGKQFANVNGEEISLDRITKIGR